MATVQSLLRGASELPGEHGTRDAEILLCHCLGKDRAWLYTWPEREIEPALEQQFSTALAARKRGTPIAYITGVREFWSLQLQVNEHTLIPRVETETLVEWALDLPLPENCFALDMGTGSGAIALALAAERPSWRITALDNSTGALEVAAKNASALQLPQVSFMCSDWFSATGEATFDLLVSNPPYIDPQDSHLGMGDLTHEPATALIAAQGGLADIASIIEQAPEHLRAGAWLLLEHGFDQGSAVRELMLAAGFSEVETRQDLAELDRATGGMWHA